MLVSQSDASSPFSYWRSIEPICKASPHLVGSSAQQRLNTVNRAFIHDDDDAAIAAIDANISTGDA
jgi:hypothetical protein